LAPAVTICQAGGGRASIPAMHRWFFGFFFYFPRHLAEGNG
jgi:hypothetical protein